MIEFSNKIDELAKKYNVKLPEGFKAELIGLQARHHLEMMSLHVEMFSKPAMWRESGSGAQSERIALDFINAQRELQKLEKSEPKPWWDRLKTPLGRKIL